MGNLAIFVRKMFGNLSVPIPVFFQYNNDMIIVLETEGRKPSPKVKTELRQTRPLRREVGPSDTTAM